MSTPMVMDLKKMSDTDLGDIDPHLYRQLIGSLMYLVNTRPDICYAVNVLSQFMSQPKHTHWIAAKHVLRYLQGTIWLWSEICSQCGLKLGRICRCRLGRKCSRQKEDFKLLLHLRINHGFLV